MRQVQQSVSDERESFALLFPAAAAKVVSWSDGSRWPAFFLPRDFGTAGIPPAAPASRIDADPEAALPGGFRVSDPPSHGFPPGMSGLQPRGGLHGALRFRCGVRSPAARAP